MTYPKGFSTCAGRLPSDSMSSETLAQTKHGSGDEQSSLRRSPGVLMPRPKGDKPPKPATSFRLSEEALRLLSLIADREASTLTYAVEMLIRQGAKNRGIK